MVLHSACKGTLCIAVLEGFWPLCCPGDLLGGNGLAAVLSASGEQ